MDMPDDPLLSDVLERLRGRGPSAGGDGAGRPLPEPARGRLEARIGRSLADARVHDSDVGAALARRHGADAITVGRHIIGGRERLDAAHPAGFALLAHEATHVVQHLAPPPALGVRGERTSAPLELSLEAAAGPRLALAPSGRAETNSAG